MFRIYSKPNCHLCDEAKVLVRRVASEFKMNIEEINIEQDPETYRKYRFDIPVVFLDETEVFRHRTTEEALRKAVLKSGKLKVKSES